MVVCYGTSANYTQSPCMRNLSSLYCSGLSCTYSSILFLYYIYYTVLTLIPATLVWCQKYASGLMSSSDHSVLAVLCMHRSSLLYFSHYKRAVGFSAGMVQTSEMIPRFGVLMHPLLKLSPWTHGFCWCCGSGSVKIVSAQWVIKILPLPLVL